MTDVAQDSLNLNHSSSKGMAGMRLGQLYYQLTAGIVITCLIAASIAAGMWLGNIPITGNVVWAVILPAISGGYAAGWITDQLLIKPADQLYDRLRAVAEDPELILPPLQGQLTDRLAYHRLADIHNGLEQLFQQIRIQLRQQQRLADVGQAVAKINHDIRNGLSVASLLADQLESSADPDTAKAGKLILTSTKMAADMCQNMMDYLAELPPARYADIEMERFIADAQTSYPLDIRYSGPEYITSDALFLSRILGNLARNAVLAQATQMHVDIWQAGHLLVIDFSDNGPGIDEARQAALFSPFAASSRAGSGLGLSICLDLALGLGGKFFLSRSSDAGSEFRLQLPLSPQKTAHM